MSLGIVLNESDLRKMPPELREELLKWYFDHGEGTPDLPQSPALGPINPTGPVSLRPQREERGRVSFPELVRAGLLVPGAELKCKALNRQRRSGAAPYFDAGKVLAGGSVEYRGKHYVVPSKLAVDVVNSNAIGVKPTNALNGYDYIFVGVSNRLVPLKELRDSFLELHSN